MIRVRALSALLGVRAAAARCVLRERDWPRLVVALAFVGLGGTAMVAEYAFLRRGFDAIAEQGVAGPPLLLYALEAFFALVLVIGILSAVVTGSAVFFRLAENRLLLVTPLAPGTIFALRSVETAVLTAWAFVLMAAPALLALGVSARRAPGFYAAGGLLLVSFLVTGVGLGITLTMALGVALGRVRSRVGIVGLAVLILGAAGLLLARTVVPSRADLAVMFEPGLLNGTTVAIHVVEDKFAGWPSHAFAAALFGLAGGRTSRPAGTLAATAAWPGLALLALVGLAAPVYRRLAGRAAEGFLLARAAGLAGEPTAVAGRAFPRRLRGAVGALIEKEAVTLLRSPDELARAGFLGFLLLLYTALFLGVPVPARSGTEEQVARVAAFALVAAGYLLTTLGLRFAYPALSGEGQAVWILLASPVRLGTVLVAKASLYSLAASLGLGVVTLVGGWRLGLPGTGLVGLASLVVLMGVTVVTVALALGAVWPDFRGRPADALATSGGGLLTVAIALAYVGATGALGFRLTLAALTGAPPSRVAVLLGLGVAGALVAALGPVVAARRRLRALEAP